MYGGEHMLYSVIITAFIALAVIGIFCYKAVRLDRCRHRVKSYLLIPCTCTERELEMLVKGCYWEEVIAGKECMRDIILLTSHNDEIRTKAESLERQFGIVRAVDVSDIAVFLGMNDN
jgi:hypothetical protein